ncbi:hypothetical protein [Demequina iriomotensis]|uniref:hypothetical protein n=1 Tax=Demequina iriomotensis TaxID=1536641 RepID=UPI000784D09F|nr:hypothetical protein [Demequina iriomotensis]
MAVEFEKLVYLDPQKTGSTFVEEVLIEVFGGEPTLRARHTPLKERDPERLHCISVRDPWDQYLSLYRYGADRRGGVYLNLKAAGLSDAYASFGDWLDVVLDPANAAMVAPNWGSTGIARFVGVQSFRYLRMALPRALERMRTMESVEDVREQHAQHKAWDVVLRTETLADDVVDMLDTHRDRLGITMSREDLDRIARQHAGANASKSKRVEMEDAHRARIASSEWLLLEEFGY